MVMVIFIAGIVFAGGMGGGGMGGGGNGMMGGGHMRGSGQGYALPFRTYTTDTCDPINLIRMAPKKPKG